MAKQERRKPRARKWIRWITIAAIIYVFIGLILYFTQQIFIFHPRKLSADKTYSFNQPFREVDIRVNEEKLINIVQFTVPDSLRKGIVLYFHGNRENIGRYAKYATNFTRNRYEVWMIDYPGYGKSTGKRTEDILYEDARLFYKMANSRVAADSIIIYGKSLGSGIAAELASVRDCKRLILETPYYSMVALAGHYFPIYPVGPFVKFRIPTYEYLDRVKAPVHMFHGTKDRVIPYRQAKKLKAEYPKSELITITKGRHNDLAEYEIYQRKIDSLLGL